jgi:cobalt-zinc-cadmium resistance protein CzcA
MRDRDMGSVVADIKKIVRESVRIPPGYFIEYGGQFENQQRAMKRLAVIVPAALSLIFLLLFMSLKSVKSALLIFLNVPLAVVVVSGLLSSTLITLLLLPAPVRMVRAGSGC